MTALCRLIISLIRAVSIDSDEEVRHCFSAQVVEICSFRYVALSRSFVADKLKKHNVRIWRESTTKLAGTEPVVSVTLQTLFYDVTYVTK